jgi:hypothetical protein
LRVATQRSSLYFYFSLYLLVAGVYLLTCAGRLGLSDGVAMYNVARSMVTEHSLSSSPCEPATEAHPNHCVLGEDGKYYAGFGLLPSLVAAPVWAVSRFAAREAHMDVEAPARAAVALLTAIVGPLVCVVLAMWAIQLGYSRRTALACALIVAFASPYWHFAVKGFYSEPYFTLALVVGGYFLSRPELRYAAAYSGLAVGAACAARISGVVVIPVFVIAIAMQSSKQLWPRKRFVADLAQFCAAGLIPGLLIGWANYARFGSPLRTGYQAAYASAGALLSTPLLRGIGELLLNREVGLVTFTPWVLLAFYFGREFWREHAAEAVLCFGTFAASLLFYAKYDSWHAGWVAGPRFLTPTIPFLALALAPQIEKLWKHRPAGTRETAFRPALVVTLVLAFLVQAFGTIYPEDRYYDLGEYYEHRAVKPWWTHSIALASLDYVAHLPWREPLARSLHTPTFSDQLAVVKRQEETLESIPASETEDEFLDSLPNSENTIEPNLMLVKMKWIGIPRSAAFAYALLALALSAAGLVGVKKAISSEPGET